MVTIEKKPKLSRLGRGGAVLQWFTAAVWGDGAVWRGAVWQWLLYIKSGFQAKKVFEMENA